MPDIEEKKGSLDVVTPSVSMEKDVKAKRKHNITPNYMIFRLIKMLARGRHYGLPGTDGSLMSVFKVTLNQDHTILSIFRAHDLHPFSQNERIHYMVNVTSVVLLFAYIGKDWNRALQYAVLIVVVKPWKSLSRCLLECKCLYTGSYDEKNDIDDADNDPMNNNVGESKANAFINICGSLAAGILTLISIIIWITVISMLITTKGGTTFFDEWLYLQLTNYIIYEPSIIFAMTFIGHVCFQSEKKNFEKHWAPYYNNYKGLDPPMSQTEIAILAKEKWIREHNNDRDLFQTKFADYDKWFEIDNVDTNEVAAGVPNLETSSV